MGNFENQMLDAIDILINQRTSNLQFDKTIRAKISQISSLSIGEYKVSYQNSLFYAYSLDLQEIYRINDEVYVQIHSGDFRKNPTILGRVSKLGEKYVNTLQIEDRFIDIGTNILSNGKQIGFISYFPTSQSVQLLSGGDITIDSLGLDLYKQEAIYLKIGGNFRTNLALEQQSGGGNYGIIVECQYYNSGLYKSHSEQDDDFINGSKEDKYIYIPYVLDVNNMLGQPYRYYTGSHQTAIFSVPGKDLKAIKAITLFCKDFPVQKVIQQVYKQGDELYIDNSKATIVNKDKLTLYRDQNDTYWHYNEDANSLLKAVDIWIKDLEFTFVEALTEEDLQGATLKIITPYGAYFKQAGDQRLLQAEVKYDGKRLDTTKTKIQFYWFIKDNSVSNGSQKYSQYAGSGWRCLNETRVVDGQMVFAPDSYKKIIKQIECPSKISWFKCVAVFDGNIIAATTKLYNLNNDRLIEITSSAGTQFDFGIGSTILTCTGAGTEYYWMYSYDGGPLMQEPRRTKNLQNVTIVEAQDFIYYEVTVYDGSDYVGSANITLYNKTDNINPFNVHIHNRSQIFKYDAYGVSPASNTKEEWDRMIIPDLSFDIYTSTGEMVELTDNEKQRMLQIRWIVPRDNTMLIVNQTEYETVYAQKGGAYQRRVLKNRANLSFAIENWYSTEKTNNDIILQVTYQGYKIMDNTNFTFTKEGEMGSNGTKYIARLVPNDNYAQEIYFVNGQIRSWSYNTDGKYSVNQTYNRTPSLKMQIWDGSDAPVFDGNPYNLSLNNNDVWTMLSKGRTQRPAYQISEAGVISQYLAINEAEHKAGIVQAKYTSNQLSGLARDYYATYPLMQVYGGSYTNAIVTGGYRFVMFQNDGSRSSFHEQAPFVLKLIKDDGTIDDSINEDDIIWGSSWNGTIKDQNNNILTPFTGTKTAKGNRVKIEPPGHYPNDGNVNEYITCTYGGTIIYISVHFYMNKYGLDAINGWDGNSIKINTEGDQYILAPQIGAGDKDSQNRFTGITMGKSFNVNGIGSGNSEIGLMGFHQGERTLFLDANTGNSIFGKASGAQIIIGPVGWGSAPAGSIFSSNYYNYAYGKPDSLRNEGMLINLVEPSIQFGSGNFVVNSIGHLTAKGGGSVAGWKITDTQLISPTDDLFLNSGGNIYGRGKNAQGTLQRHDSLNATGEGFYLGPDGLSIGSKFFANNEGIVRIGSNAVRGTYGKYWTIDGNGSGNSEHSYIKSGTEGQRGSVYLGTDKIALGNQFCVDSDGIVRVGYNAFSGSDTNPYWTINGSSGSSYISYRTNNFNATTYGNKLIINSSARDQEVYIGTNGLRLGSKAAIDNRGNATFNSGTIGGWTINQDSLQAGNIYLRSDGTIQGGTNYRWKISPNGEASFSGLKLDGVDFRQVISNNAQYITRTVYGDSSSTLEDYFFGYNKLQYILQYMAYRTFCIGADACVLPAYACRNAMWASGVSDSYNFNEVKNACLRSLENYYSWFGGNQLPSWVRSSVEGTYSTYKSRLQSITV